jgi:hypothetical protein
MLPHPVSALPPTMREPALVRRLGQQEKQFILYVATNRTKDVVGGESRGSFTMYQVADGIKPFRCLDTH